MHPAIEKYKDDIYIICKRYRVSKLDVFGSAARKDDFNATSSDADFLIEFAPEVKVGLGELIGIKTELKNQENLRRKKCFLGKHIEKI